jgi:hypothetical protein
MLEKPLANGCFKLSIPGVLFALAIHPGYYSKGTIVSDFMIVIFNGTLYSIPLLYLRSLIRKRARSS